MKPVVDSMTRKILARLQESVPLDHGALAQQVGCAEEVVRHRIGQLEEAGLLKAYRLRLIEAPGATRQEALLLGVPGPTTDQEALARAAGMPGVVQAFTLASRASFAVQLCGRDATDVEERASRIAEAAGLEGHQVVLVLRSIAGQDTQTDNGTPQAGSINISEPDGSSSEGAYTEAPSNSCRAR